MSSDSQNIRNILNLLESREASEIDFGPLHEGWVDNLKSKLDRRLGNKERAAMADRFTKEWYKWLGQTNRNGTKGDMVRFMEKRIGFKDEDIDEVFSNVYHEDAPEAEEADGVEGAAPAEEPQDGRPIPKDLDTKLSDYGEVGQKDAEPAGGRVVEINPKRIMTNGQIDDVKLRAAMDRLKPGDTLKYGNESRRKKPQGEPDTQFYDESITEAEEDDTEVLSRQEVGDIMDTSAAIINDNYLMDGPENDAAAAADQQAKQPGNWRQRGLGPNSGNKMASGSYDKDEANNILKILELPQTHVKSLTSKVSKEDVTFGQLSDKDVEDLAKVGFAILRSRT
jgi:hypothetical protein